MGKNNIMYLWRIVFTYIIALHHLFNAYGRGCGWYIGVDFFSIMSGYLLLEHVDNHQDEKISSYIWKRFLLFSPALIISGLIRLCIERTIQGGGMITFLDLLTGMPQFLLINAYGIFPSWNSVDWYIQSLFLLCIPLYWLFRCHKSFMIWFSPLCFVVIYSFLIHKFGYMEGMSREQLYEGIIYWPTLRVFSGLLLGAFAWEISQRIKKQQSHFFALLSSILFVFVIYCSWKYGKARTDFLYAIILGIAVALGFSQNFQSKIWTGSLIKFLSNISLYIYLNHYIFKILIRTYINSFSVSTTIIYLLFITLFSVLLYSIVDKFLCGKLRIVRDAIERAKHEHKY